MNFKTIILWAEQNHRMGQVLIDLKVKMFQRRKSNMNKRMYKLELLCVKYVPIIIAFGVLLDAILSYFDIYCDELYYLIGTSFFTLIPMYISSIVYKFCKYHRMFIHYILAHKIVASVDMYIGIPVTDGYMLLIYLIIAGIFAFLALYFHQKYGGRRNE